MAELYLGPPFRFFARGCGERVGVRGLATVKTPIMEGKLAPTQRHGRFLHPLS
jgi:hypothetical protein